MYWKQKVAVFKTHDNLFAGISENQYILVVGVLKWQNLGQIWTDFDLKRKDLPLCNIIMNEWKRNIAVFKTHENRFMEMSEK